MSALTEFSLIFNDTCNEYLVTDTRRHPIPVWQFNTPVKKHKTPKGFWSDH